MKAYTDINQSKKLAKILPLESADMYYSDVPVREWMDKTNISKGTHVVFKSQIFAIENLRNHEIGEGDIYAWSLAALLDILSNTAYIIDEDGSVDLCDYKNIEWSVCLSNTDVGLFTADNPIDACVAMIEKLHEQNLL